MPDNTLTGDGPTPLTADEVRSLHKELQGQHSGRNSEYAAYREMYRGKHWGQPGLPLPDKASLRYTLTANYIRPTVDKSVQLLLGQMPAMQVMPPGADEPARKLAESMEALLYNAWEKNDAPITLRRVAFNQMLLGVGLIYYWWDSNGKRPRFRSIAPDNYYPVYDGETVVEAILVSRRNTRTLKSQYPDRADEIVPDSTGDDVFDEDRWARTYGDPTDPLNQNSQGPGSDRQVAGTAQTTVYDWFDTYGNHVRVMGNAEFKQKLNYKDGRIPIIEFPYGTPGDERDSNSDINDIIDLNLYLDDLLSDGGNVIRKYAHPTILDKGSGVAPEVISRALTKDGGIIPIRKDGDVAFLTWEGMPPDFDGQYNRVLGLIYDISGKPPASYGQTNSNQSGVATNMALSPTTASTEERASLFGHGLQTLNEKILMLYERFMKGEQIDVRGRRPKRAGTSATVFYKASIRGAEIDGWYMNRIRWPSALRTDDPVYVQNELAKMQSDPPVQSVFTTMENLGIEDSEMELDLVKEQLADPRMHPDRLTASVGAATALQGAGVPAGLEGLDPNAADTGSLDAELIDNNTRAAGSPHSEQITETGY